MEGFDFRLRFHLFDGERISHDSSELVILHEESGRTLRLTSGEKGVAINSQSRAALLGGPYESEKEAWEAAYRAKRAVLVWATNARIGVDLGDGRLRSGMTHTGLRMMSRTLGHSVRNDVHGIDVYPYEEGLRFVTVTGEVSVGRDPRTFADIVAREFESSSALTDKQVVAAELFCSAFFDVSFRSRIVTLVSSIEALLEPPERPPAALALVDDLIARVSQVGLDAKTQASMVGSLQFLRRDSITQTGKSLARRLLSGKTYLGQEPADFFVFLYQMRSDIVHRGRLDEPLSNEAAVEGACQEFVQGLLLASFDELRKQSESRDGQQTEG